MRWTTNAGSISLTPQRDTPPPPVPAKERLSVQEAVQRALDATNSGDHALSEKLCRAVLKLHPEHFIALNILGNALQRAGNNVQALQVFDQLLAIKSEVPEFHFNRANVLGEMGRMEEAVDGYREAISLKPDFVVAHNNLGNILQKLERFDEARLCYKIALELDPDYAQSHNNLGGLHQVLGEFEQAISCYERALEIDPEYSTARRHLAAIKEGGHDVGQLEDINRQLDTDRLDPVEASNLWFARAHIHEDAGDYEAAFNSYLEGNRVFRGTYQYDPGSFTRLIERLEQYYTPERVQQSRASGDPTDLPVFILGMPRSGTTLAEQILSSHPQVHGAGELEFFAQQESGMRARLKLKQAWPQCIDELSAGQHEGLRTEFLTRLRQGSGEEIRVTDKMPLNALRIGFIKQLFPNARIIHCQRNPLDTCVSIFSQKFSGANPFAYDLAELKQFYQDYLRAMALWNVLYPDDILNMRYEDVVEDIEENARRMVAHIGLEWDSGCLDYTNNKRPILTASSVQARKPVYTSSVERWRRYEPWLGDLVELLDTY